MKRASNALGALAVSLGAILGAGSAMAQPAYPSRPIRIVVPLPPGANGDLMPRILGQHLAAKLGQPVVIENRPGAAQNLGAELVYRSDPDGYTLLATPQGPLVISQSFFPKLGFDPREFVPITIMARLPYILVVHPKLPVKTFAEFIAYAKAHPNTLNDASPSTGSGPHLTGEMLKLASGIKTTHVPYSGMAPALNDLIAGHVEMMFDNLGNSLPLVKEGKLRGLAVTSEQRAPEIAELPAIAETYPEVVASSFFTIVAPPKTPPEIAEKLSRAFDEILHEPEIQKRWGEMSLTGVGGTPAEIRAMLDAESARWRRVIEAGGLGPK
jgi:tripartite-type tricarboxylate transporter receptor subunit TctC